MKKRIVKAWMMLTMKYELRFFLNYPLCLDNPEMNTAFEPKKVTFTLPQPKKKRRK